MIVQEVRVLPMLIWLAVDGLLIAWRHQEAKK